MLDSTNTTTQHLIIRQGVAQHKGEQKSHEKASTNKVLRTLYASRNISYIVRLEIVAPADSWQRGKGAMGEENGKDGTQTSTSWQPSTI